MTTLRTRDQGDSLFDIEKSCQLVHGDWVPYFKGQSVKFNVMDRDAKGVQTLGIQRGDTVVEKIQLSGPGVVERVFSRCGD